MEEKESSNPKAIKFSGVFSYFNGKT